MNEQPSIPYSTDAEKAVLGSILLTPDAVMSLCGEIGVSADWFFISGHQEIYRVLSELTASAKAIDFVTLATLLKDKGRLDYVGGAPYLNDLFTYIPTAANVRYYIEIVEQKYHLRRAIQLANEVKAMALDCDDSDEVMDKMEAGCLEIRSNRYKPQAATMKTLAMRAVGEIQALYDNRGKITGIETGFRELDVLTNGAHPEELTIIAARPSVGKTALALNIATHMASNGVHCVFFSGEMSKAQIAQRILCGGARVNAKKIAQGLLSERDFPALGVSAAKMAAMTMLIDDFTGPTIEYMAGVCRRQRRLVASSRMAVFIDYAGLCTTRTKTAGMSRQQELGAVSRGAKGISKEFGCPVYLLSQLSRESSKQQRRPRLIDLRESGDLEQDADNVFLLHRAEMEMDADDDRIEDERGKAELIVAKQRNGSVGDIVRLTYLKEFTRFEDRATTEV